MRGETTRVEQLVSEKAELRKQLNDLETYRRNIRLGDTFKIEESAPSARLRRMFFRGGGLAGTGQRTEIPGFVVREFYRFTGIRSTEIGARLNEINDELQFRSKTDQKES